MEQSISDDTKSSITPFAFLKKLEITCFSTHSFSQTVNQITKQNDDTNTVQQVNDHWSISCDKIEYITIL